MDSTKAIAILILATISNCVADGGFCGQAKPDPAKTCISIRLPWKPEPIYFCTEKFQHQPACGNMYQTPNQCMNQYTNNSLLIATPWDCCPTQSQPIATADICKGIMCDPKPIGRTCIDLRNTSSSSHQDSMSAPLNCCPKWFCEEGMNAENPTCSHKILEPSCNKPPKDKKKCIGFYDHFGCCTKFQCEGEGKPGTCPSSGGAHFGMVHQRRHYHGHIPQVEQSCIGDHSCPGTMKCCGHGGVASVFMTGDDGYSHAIMGTCTEPASEGKSSEGDAATESADDASPE